MVVKTTLAKDKNSRYYLANRYAKGVAAFIDGTIVFDKKYYQMLTKEELLAVGAHEFTHLVRNHARKIFLRIVLLPLVILLIAGLLILTLGMSELAAVSSLLLALSALVISSYLNAPLQRQQEAECDLYAVKFGYGEALITALLKLGERFPKSKWDAKLSKFLPRTYPTLEQRIQHIRRASAAVGIG
jgi:STE24 endopeptidase